MSEYVIKVDDLIHNINVVKKLANTEIIGVIKGNGYGFGMNFMAELLKSEGIKTFAVTEITDIEPLRNKSLLDEDILIMRSTCISDEAEIIVKNYCTATVGSYESGFVLNEAAKKLGIKVKANIKIDTGMCRYGFTKNQFDEIIQTYKECDFVDFTGIYTHFSSAFTQKELTKKQLDTFNSVVEKLRGHQINVGKVYAANSPALLNVENTSLDAVRIGSAFTGRVVTSNKTDLKRVGYLRSQVIEIKDVPKGTPVGYNGAYVTKRDTKIAIVPVGHYDGFGVEKAQDINDFKTFIHSVLSLGKRLVKKDRLSVKINDKKANVIGHIGLSHTAVDITDIDVKIGDYVKIDVSPLFINPNVKRIYE